MAKNIEFGFEFRGKRWNDAQRGLEYFAKNLSQGTTKLGPVVGRQLQFMLDAVVSAMEQRHGNPWPATTPTSLSVRSGAGLKSIKDSVKIIGSTLNDIRGEIGAGFPMSVHENGAIIRAKKAKYLTIPLPAALDSHGLPLKKSARDWDNTFVAKSRKGNLLIFRKELSKIVPLYVLKKEVKIPPRLGLEKTIRAGIPYFVDKTMQAMVAELLKAAG